MALRNPGQVLNNRYEIKLCIGQGAMGAVYLADDLLLAGARWAVKELELPLLAESERPLARQLFRREQTLLSQLNHPGIPHVVECFTEPDGSECIVMQYIEGLPLDEILGTLSRSLLPVEALPIGLQITHVLEYLHKQNPPVIFRDLKPSNLMVTPVGRVYFIDFGIARLYKPAQQKDTQDLGTPGFCAPEQYGHGQTTPRSDIYAVGTTLFHLLTRADVQQYNFNFPALSTLTPVPAKLEEALAKCLKLKPEDRYTDAVALRADLEIALGQAGRAPAGSTQPLGLYYLSHHPVVRQEGLPAGFWKSWLKRTFLPGL